MIDLIVLLILLALGYGFGRITELKHYRSIIKREDKLRNIPVIASKYPPMSKIVSDPTLVAGNVVISIDYFKRFIATLRNLVGGPITSYESLIDRARREAILRMKAEAKKCGATMIFNIKIETASIYKGTKNSIGSVEVLAYGTAISTK